LVGVLEFGVAISAKQSKARRAIAAAAAGNVLEWYDFVVYAYMANALAKNFFPAADALSSLLQTYAAFGIGFVARPIGGVIIGRLGDLRGRKFALLVTMASMAAAMLLIGLAPTYASIGSAAPALVIFARILQGLSAGGEWASATAFMVEWAPPRRRGLYGSLQQCSVAAGLLLGAVAAAALSVWLTPAEVDAWGWRLPFLVGVLIAPIGYYLRRHIDDTPAYRARDADRPNSPPWLAAARAVGMTVVWSVAYYLVLSFMPVFLHKELGLTSHAGSLATAAGLIAIVLLVPLFGALSDHFGRKPVLLGGALGLLVYTYPAFVWLASQPSPTVALCVQLGFAVFIAAYSGAGPAAIAELFATASRSTWLSIAYSAAVAVFGGFAPYIATRLVGVMGSPVAPSIYLVAAAAVSTLVILRFDETAFRELR
jgi:MHS family proline/betaine transporter-like MFS transporter